MARLSNRGMEFGPLAWGLREGGAAAFSSSCIQRQAGQHNITGRAGQGVCVCSIGQIGLSLVAFRLQHVVVACCALRHCSTECCGLLMWIAGYAEAGTVVGPHLVRHRPPLPSFSRMHFALDFKLAADSSWNSPHSATQNEWDGIQGAVSAVSTV